jgi:16S rRNA (guanine527-N7)-methyltransferase
MERLKKYLDKLTTEEAAKALRSFDIYYEELTEWNEKFNLTAIKGREETIVKHFADSLEGLPYFAGRILDVGSGAGFPSVPIAIADKTLRFTLIDSINKKVNFLKHIIDKLSLNAKVLHIRAEDIAGTGMRESFDTVTARAVAPLNTLAEYVLPLVKVGGSAVIYKGEATEELEQAEKAILTLGGSVKEVKKYSLPGIDNDRTLIIIKKIVKTPPEYPRQGNKARQSPIM